MQQEENYKTLSIFRKKWAVAEVVVSYKPKTRTNIFVHNDNDAYNVLMRMWDQQLISICEQLCILFLSSSNEVLGFRAISTGNQDSATVDFRLITTLALACRADKVILAHNHPSCLLQPSNGDLKVTSKLDFMLGSFGIMVVDHLIITPADYYSFKKHGHIVSDGAYVDDLVDNLSTLRERRRAEKLKK